MRALPVLAVLAALAHLLFEGSMGAAAPFVKAVPVATLAWMVWASVRARETGSAWARGGRLAAFGLAVSALADMAIEWSFLAGLFTFLVAHLLYIGAFLRVTGRGRLSRLLPLLVWAAALLPRLVSHAGALALPVAIYGCVIFAMMWRAAAAWDAGDRAMGRLAFAGALFFGLSDSLLGWNRFVAPLPFADLLVMLTYWSGQALIAAGFLRRD